MATYAELIKMRSDSNLQDKVAVAVMIAAHAKLSAKPPPTAAEAAWANRVLADPGAISKSVVNAVLAANKAASVATIQVATDVQIQANVDAVVDGIILGA